MKRISLVIAAIAIAQCAFSQTLYVPNGTPAGIGTSSNTGKVGIGAGLSSPSANLQVGSGTVNGLINLGGYAHIGSLRSSGDFFAGMNVFTEYGTGEDYKIKILNSNPYGFSAIQLGYAGDINFFSKNGSVTANDQVNTSNYSVMKITGSGLMGIGTFAPVSLLTLNRNGSGAQTSELTIQSNATNVSRFGWNAGGYLDISALFNNNHIILTPHGTGNVGIGTTAPSSVLTLNRNGSGAQPSEVLIQSNTTNVASFGWSDAGYVHVSSLYNNNHIVLKPTGTGNVGVGTTTPNEKLTVNGNQSVNGNLFVGADGNISTISGPANSGAIQIKTNSAQGGSANRYLRLGWKDNNAVFSSALAINDNLNVGIGTLNPDTKLTVKGTIHSEEVRVDVNVPVPDYVFEKDYDLLSLSELETYINQNKHLPEVPSAKEMEANGLNLKEMNLLLLKKVEELTLHLIEMEKRYEAQQKTIESLKNKN